MKQKLVGRIKEQKILKKALESEVAEFVSIIATKTKKQIFLTFLSSFPIVPNQHSIGLIDQALTMDALFFQKIFKKIVALRTFFSFCC